MNTYTWGHLMAQDIMSRYIPLCDEIRSIGIKPETIKPVASLILGTNRKDFSKDLRIIGEQVVWSNPYQRSCPVSFYEQSYGKPCHIGPRAITRFSVRDHKGWSIPYWLLTSTYRLGESSEASVLNNHNLE